MSTHRRADCIDNGCPPLCSSSMQSRPPILVLGTKPSTSPDQLPDQLDATGLGCTLELQLHRSRAGDAHQVLKSSTFQLDSSARCGEGSSEGSSRRRASDAISDSMNPGSQKTCCRSYDQRGGPVHRADLRSQIGVAAAIVPSKAQHALLWSQPLGESNLGVKACHAARWTESGDIACVLHDARAGSHPSLTMCACGKRLCACSTRRTNRLTNFVSRSATSSPPPARPAVSRPPSSALPVASAR